MEKALIVGGGPVSKEQLLEELSLNPDRIIAVDAGGKYFQGLGIYPDTIVGDFDSLSPEALSLMAQNNVQIYRYPSQKDQTDLELAMDLAIEAGAQNIIILGGLGGRFDHSLGNVGLLVRALEKKCQAWLIDQEHRVTVMNSQLSFDSQSDWAISLIPLTSVVTGVTTEGLEYPLCEETLFFTSTRGLHNRFLKPKASVKINQGILLIVQFRED